MAVSRRYNDFVQLDRKLQKTMLTITARLPPKVWFRKNGALIVEKRRKELEEYLNHCLCQTSLHTCPELAEFFDYCKTIVVRVIRRLCSGYVCGLKPYCSMAVVIPLRFPPPSPLFRVLLSRSSSLIRNRYHRYSFSFLVFLRFLPSPFTTVLLDTLYN